LYDPLSGVPNERELAAARDHMNALLKTLKTYLPWPVIRAPQPTGVPAGSMYRGVFLFGDVSGFTPLSEKLKVLGQQGAEIMTALIIVPRPGQGAGRTWRNAAQIWRRRDVGSVSRRNG
jgi:hypothetical protein